jgi:hypothetical protein
MTCARHACSTALRILNLSAVPKPLVSGCRMILRAIVVCLVACNLLVCPLLCLAQVAAGGATPRAGRACRACGCCCPKPQPDSGRERPANSRSDQGGTCLCHGAVLMKPVVSLPSPQGELAVFVLPEMAAGHSWQVAVADTGGTGRTACHFASADSGRKVRALIESFLL